MEYAKNAETMRAEALNATRRIKETLDAREEKDMLANLLTALTAELLIGS
jgi:hypothetical protein